MSKERKKCEFCLSLNQNLCAKTITDYSKEPFSDARLPNFILFLQILKIPSKERGGFPVVLSTILITTSRFARGSNRKMSFIKLLTVKPGHFL